jgi:hypothetical protein
MPTNIKHYIISLAAGVVAYLLCIVLTFIPAPAVPAIALLIAWFMHHYLENSDSLDIIPVQPPAVALGTAANSSPPVSDGVSTKVGTA